MPISRLLSDPANGQVIAKWTVAAYICIGAALLLLLAITGWGAYVDLVDVRRARLQGEVGRLRSHAVRTVSRIQDRMSLGHALEKAIREDDWLRVYWNRWVPLDKSRPYVAIVNDTGVIVMHSNPALEGNRLTAGWYFRTVPDAGDDVVETTDSRLAPADHVYDISVPIIHHDQEVATYHTALDPEWMDDALTQTYAQTWQRWVLIVAGMLTVVTVAGVSLYTIFKRTVQLREAVEMARMRRFAELGELAAGIAHEIRNPLNAIRLNLHALQRLQRFVPEGNESVAVIAEANREIDRVEGLMRIMLGYARPEKAVEEDLDLRSELEATINFLRPVMERDRVEVELQLPDSPRYVHIDRNRFRQIVLNLMNNAREATGSDGRIEVRLESQADAVEIVVADDGPGVPTADRQRIFDPFYSTKELGTGLGLALVKRFVEEAGGEIACGDNASGGACFRVSFSEVARESVGEPLL